MVLEATIVIPKEVREKGGIKEGDVLEVSVKEEVIVLLRDTTWERFHGCARDSTIVEKVVGKSIQRVKRKFCRSL